MPPHARVVRLRTPRFRKKTPLPSSLVFARKRPGIFLIINIEDR